jgi:hypothetical protein
MQPTNIASAARTSNTKTPPLQAGDHLGAADFLRRSEATSKEVLAEYVPLQPDSEGILRSPHLAGLWLNVRALLAQDRRQHLRTLDDGLQGH